MIRKNLGGSNPSPVVYIHFRRDNMAEFKEIRQGVILISTPLPDNKSEDHLIIVDYFGAVYIFEAKKIN